jgi:hypothetical protein
VVGLPDLEFEKMLRRVVELWGEYLAPGDRTFALEPERQRGALLHRNVAILLAQGPIACPEYLHCVEATTDGCGQYVGDTENASMLAELYQRAEHRREQARAAVHANRPVLAGKHQELAIRAARMRDQAFAIARPEIIDEVKRRLLTTREQVEGGK